MLTPQQFLNILRAGAAQGLNPNQLRFLRARLKSENETPETLEKIQRIVDGIDKEQRNLTDETEKFVLSTTGNFLSSEVIKNLKLSSRNEIQNISQILRRLEAKGTIEKYGNKNGLWRLIDRAEEDIDIFGEDEPDMKLKFPFCIEDLIIPMERNVFIIAGEKDAGKTAYLLNFAELNMRVYNVYYFSSEMGKREMRNRMKKFDIPFEDWKHLHLKERMANFQDVIRPDDINIIDFLEVTKDFYLIGEMIKDIYVKLKKGICFIAIQKNRERKLKDGTTTGNLGIGGERGLEKARLYLAIGVNTDGNHICKIIVGKNWRDEEFNPKGLELQYKLAKGCKFIVEKWWEKEGKPIKATTQVKATTQEKIDKQLKRKDLFDNDPDFIPEALTTHDDR